jgi:hypothetical protein
MGRMVCPKADTMGAIYEYMPWTNRRVQSGRVGSMTRYVALIDGKPGAYGITFPDLPGCTAVGAHD